MIVSVFPSSLCCISLSPPSRLCLFLMTWEAVANERQKVKWIWIFSLSQPSPRWLSSSSGRNIEFFPACSSTCPIDTLKRGQEIVAASHHAARRLQGSPTPLISFAWLGLTDSYCHTRVNAWRMAKLRSYLVQDEERSAFKMRYFCPLYVASDVTNLLQAASLAQVCIIIFT